MTTRILEPDDDDRARIVPPRGRDTAAASGAAETADPVVALTGARGRSRAAPPGIVVVAGAGRSAALCMSRMTIHDLCIVMQAR
jgi:hypothetical protein